MSVLGRILLYGVVVGICVGCCHPEGSLSVKHQYLDSRYLASSYVGTPDPRPYWGYCGQQLIIRWSYPSSYLDYPDLHLYLTVRLCNQQIDERCISTPCRKGRYVYRLMNQDYCDANGILTYKIEVRSGSCVVECWDHQVWMQLIECAQ